MSDSHASSSTPSSVLKLDPQLAEYRRTLISNHHFLRATCEALHRGKTNILTDPRACRSTINRWTLQYAVLKSHYNHYVELLAEIEENLLREDVDGDVAKRFDMLKDSEALEPEMKGHRKRQSILEKANNEELRDLLILEVTYQHCEVKFINIELEGTKDWLIDLPGLTM